MREMLVPIFGESGAVVAQFVLTLVAVLILVGAAIWLMRRYGTGAFSPATRNRVPRLALVDALAVDGRRRLVLVRRDHVEHLILIGGPTDVVVEPTIVRGVSVGARPRQGQAARPATPSNGTPQAAAGPSPAEPVPPPPEPVQAPPRPSALLRPAPAPAPPEAASPVPMPAAAGRTARPAPAPPPPPSPRRMPPAAGAEPIPFPQPQRVSEPDADLPLPSIRRSAAAAARPASGHFAETTRPTRIESVFALADALDDIADEPEASPAAPFEPVRAVPPSAPPRPSAAAPHDGDDEPLPEYLSLANDEPAPSTAAEEIAEGPPPGDGSASKVSDLEREMARLLGEITAKRGG